MAPSSFTSFARVLGTTSPAFKWRMYVGIMPTPWLSWPIRFARTRCSATRSASAATLPPFLTIALIKRRSWSAVARTRSSLAPRRWPDGRRSRGQGRSIPAIRQLLTKSAARAQDDRDDRFDGGGTTDGGISGNNADQGEEAGPRRVHGGRHRAHHPILDRDHGLARIRPQRARDGLSS